MAKPNYTKNQQKALAAETNTAVSASAGSGKTTVMVAKILRDLEQTEIDNILILTYNNSIAAEMKAKIISALFDGAKNEHNEIKRQRYLSQIDKIQFADISTIHGFCNRLIKSNFEALGIDPTYDVSECNDLSQRALKEVLDGYYASDDETFQKLAEYLLSKPNDDYLEKTILKIYRLIDIQPRPEETLEKLKIIHTKSLAAEPAKVVFDYYKKLFADYLKIWEEIKKRVECYSDKKENERYINIVKTIKSDIETVAAANNLSELSSLCDELTKKSIRLLKFNGDAELANIVKETKNSLYSDMKEVSTARLKDAYGYTVGDKTIADNGSELKLKLLEIVGKYLQRFSELKRKNCKLDYGDLEHFAVKLLDDENRLKAIGAKYRLVFVDEYQDVNASQEYIIDRVASGARTFMVGDVKQSIYCFRSANPEIFSQRLSRYDAENGGKSVYFNDNFRCNYEILNYVNRIFDIAMTKEFAGVDYKNTARFITETADGKKIREGGLVKAAFFEKPKKTGDKWENEGVFSLKYYVEPETAELKSEKAEAQLICDKIESLVGKRILGDPNGKICEYGDISVLVRSKNAAKEILAALKAQNIPVSASRFENQSSTSERDEIVNFLRVLDNEIQDIPLVGYLLGYLGGFSKSELADVRLFGKQPRFYDNLTLTANSDTLLGQKVKKAMEFLQQNRRIAASTDLFDYLNTFISTSGFEAYVLSKPDGKDKLMALRRFVYGLKGQAYAKSLHSFLTYWDGKDKEEDTPSAVSDGRSVVVQSMHASKGLEYPIVFVANIGTAYNCGRGEGSVSVDDKLGLGIQVFDEEERNFKPSLLTFAIKLEKQAKQKAEEMRLLYVALTRAKYQLYVSGTFSTTADGKVKPLLKCNCMLDLIEYADFFDGGILTDDDVRTVQPVKTDKKPQPVVQFVAQNTIYNKIIDEIINHKYKYAKQTTAEQKYSVTALNKAEEGFEEAPKTSLFDDGDRRSVGIAYHSVMENIDFNLSTEDEVKAAIDDMAKEGIIDFADAALINTDEILACIQNPELRRILGFDNSGKEPPQIFTELPFTLLVEADKVLDNPGYNDKVLVQGVLDLLVLGEQNVVVDYKNSLKSPEKLAETYKKQLYLYKMAVETSFGEKVDKIALYSFPNKSLYYL